jgi:hypothetical protein
VLVAAIVHLLFLAPCSARVQSDGRTVVDRKLVLDQLRTIIQRKPERGEFTPRWLGTVGTDNPARANSLPCRILAI